jgi:tetratricopeptide (TPR) repeat protein
MSGMPRPRLLRSHRLLASLLALGAPALAPLAAAASTTPAAAANPAPSPAPAAPEAVNALRDIVARQKAALADARKKDDPVELEDLRPRLQRIVEDYERLLTRHPGFAAGWAAYGLFLCDPAVEDHKAALPLLLRANSLDGEIPVVKNQIGVIMAEQGRVIDAFNYFLAAAELAPTEPLYHFQIALLIAEGRDDFLRTRAWTRPALDKTMLEAFARAAALAPDRTDFAYRAAEAYYDLAEPRWEEAYRLWTALEQRLAGRLETQTVRLHRARTLWKQGLAGDARELLDSVNASELATQKAKLAAEFAADEEAERRPAAPGSAPGSAGFQPASSSPAAPAAPATPAATPAPEAAVK